jgi:hypothetical protein
VEVGRLLSARRRGILLTEPRDARRERDVLEHAVEVVAEQAAKADALVDESLAAGLGGSHPVTVQAKMLRLELLNVKADLERELGTLVLDCSECGNTVHWVAGLGVTPDTGRTASRRPTMRPHSSWSLLLASTSLSQRRAAMERSPSFTPTPLRRGSRPPSHSRSSVEWTAALSPPPYRTALEPSAA